MLNMVCSIQLYFSFILVWKLRTMTLNFLNENFENAWYPTASCTCLFARRMKMECCMSEVWLNPCIIRHIPSRFSNLCDFRVDSNYYIIHLSKCYRKRQLMFNNVTWHLCNTQNMLRRTLEHYISEIKLAWWSFNWWWKSTRRKWKCWIYVSNKYAAVKNCTSVSKSISVLLVLLLSVPAAMCRFPKYNMNEIRL